MLTILNSIFLGIIQGMTEWFPVSSSGHLALFQELLGISVPVAFDVWLHFATLIVILLFFWKDITKIAMAVLTLKTNTAEFKLAMYIITAAILTSLIVFPLKDKFEATFSNLLIIGISFMITGLLLMFTKNKKGISRISLKSSVIIGIAQGIAFLPGISRSGSTIATALILGTKKEEAFRFSFLIAIPAILGSSLLKIPELASSGISLTILAAGFVSAFLIGFVSLFMLKKIISKNKFHYFAYYCFAIGIIALMAVSNSPFGVLEMNDKTTVNNLGEYYLINCSNITGSGSYRLSGDIKGGSDPICFELSANDIHIDCQNYSIEGNSSISSYGIKAKGINNISVKNCDMVKWWRMISAETTTNIVVDNVRFRDNLIDGYAMNVHWSGNINITNVFLNNTHAGLYSGNSENFSIINTTWDRNSQAGVSWALYFDSGSRNYHVSNAKIYRFGRAFILENATDGTFENIEIEKIQSGREHGNYPSIAIELTCWKDCARNNVFRNFTINNVIPNRNSPDTLPNCAIFLGSTSRQNTFIGGNISSNYARAYDLCLGVNYGGMIQNNTFINTNYSTEFFQLGNIDFSSRRFLKVDISDKDGNPIENSNVSIYNKDLRHIESKNTNKKGIAEFDLKEFLYSGRNDSKGVKADYSDYKVEADKFKNKNSTIINLSESQNINLILPYQ